jgi:hypothetical protein
MGRPAFGAIVLAAFLLYGIGSAFAARPIGLLLVALNSAAVTAAGLIGFRLMHFGAPRIGLGYFAARGAEGVLLGAGIILVEFADAPEAGDAAYLLAMLALGIGSVPFCHALGRERWLSQVAYSSSHSGYSCSAEGSTKNAKPRTHRDNGLPGLGSFSTLRL